MDSKSDKNDKNRLISMGEAAKLYGFTRFHFSQLARKGRLKASMVGGRWVTTPAAVEEYLESRQKRGAFKETDD